MISVRPDRVSSRCRAGCGARARRPRLEKAVQRHGKLERIPICWANPVDSPSKDSPGGSEGLALADGRQAQDVQDEKQGYLTFPFGDGCELFVSELQDGRLNMSEVFVTRGAGSDTERLRPKTTGDIQAEPDFFQVVPADVFTSADVMKHEEEVRELEHVIFVREGQRDPLQLDFKATYCFNCLKEEFYRVQFINVVEEALIESPLLRFQPDENRFLLDNKEDAPSPWAVNLAAEADALGVPHVISDRDHEAIALAPPPPEEEEEKPPLPPNMEEIQGQEASQLLEELTASVAERTAAGVAAAQEREDAGELGDMTLKEYEAATSTADDS